MTSQSNVHNEQDQNLFDIKKVEGLFMEKNKELVTAVKEANEEYRTETKGKINEISAKCIELGDKLHEMQQKNAESTSAANDASLGEKFTECEQWKSMSEGRQGQARMELKTAIINATGQNQPLVPSDRLGGIIADPNRIFTIRDLCPVGTTSSNLIEFAKENVFTNSAGPQVGGSPEAFENVTKPESAITFTLATAAVTTLAHFIPASKQVIDDASMLQSYINSRLMYGLKLYEESQLLNGTGSNGQLNGIVTQATAWANESPNLTNKVDVIRNAIKQAHLSEYRPNAIVMHPTDWYDIDVKKVGSSDDRYVVGNPSEMGQPRLWGLPVVITNSMTAGSFLLGAFDLGCQIWDRQQASIEVSRENSDNFVKNMITILVEERLALTVYRPGAFITGSFAGTS
jgi:HK97 family phage major capsid protein